MVVVVPVIVVVVVVVVGTIYSVGSLCAEIKLSRLGLVSRCGFQSGSVLLKVKMIYELLVLS